MNHLIPPDVDDEIIWISLAHSSRPMQLTRNSVLAAYSEYKKQRGAPLTTKPLGISNTLKERLHNLYKRHGHPLEFINDTRKKNAPLVCSMCGSLHNYSLDHVWPRSTYPEFSIFSLNLVPACSCNSARQDTLKGTSPKQRILHPYFDSFLSKRVIRMKIKKPFRTPKLEIISITKSPKIKPAVDFHIESVLKKTNILNTWATHWGNILRDPHAWFEFPNKKLTVDEVRDRLEKKLANFDTIRKSKNNWDSMLLAGMIASNGFIKYFTKHLNGIFDKTIDPFDF